MKKIIVLFLLPFLFQTAFAQDADNNGVTFKSSLLLIATTIPEAKVTFTQNFIFPFLQGSSVLTKDNNIDLELIAEVSPVHLCASAEAILTPAAFFLFSAGGKAGWAWNPMLFGSRSRALGLNLPAAGDKAEFIHTPFDGTAVKLYTGGTIQMDLAAFFPGDWNHVVMQSYHEINYKYYSAAKAGVSWYYESDDGENINGFNYYGNLIIGYQMPIFLNLAALVSEADLFLYNTIGREQWGDQKIRWTFSLLLNFSFIKNLEFSLITQLRTRKNYLETDWEDLYYRNRTMDPANPMSLKFYRVAASVLYKF
jgi:hypothetical protein